MQLMKVTTETAAPCLDPRDVQARLSSAVPPFILDLRDENEFRCVHIAGALHVPADDLNRALSDLSPDREYVTVCQSGARSGVAAWHMRAAGYQVVTLCGGLRAWERAGLAVEHNETSDVKRLDERAV